MSQNLNMFKDLNILLLEKNLISDIIRSNSIIEKFSIYKNYPSGLTKEHLSKFIKLWKNKPIEKYMILGNHEYSGIPVKLYLKNDYWIMPDYCYLVELQHCDIIMIDTMQLEPCWDNTMLQMIGSYINNPFKRDNII